MNKIVSLCKRRGFIYPGSEIYGGLSNSWDYGPLGVELKNSIKHLWWKKFVHERNDMVGIDAALIMNPKVWEESGHLKNFTDPLVECKNCHERFRIDKLIEDRAGLSLPIIYSNYLTKWKEDFEPRFEKWKKNITKKTLEFMEEGDKLSAEINRIKRAQLEAGIISPEKAIEKINIKPTPSIDYEPDDIGHEIREFKKIVDGGIPEFLEHLISLRKIPCTNCGKREFTFPKNFNLMFQTYIGPTEDKDSIVYLRPETAQGIFINFKNVLDTTRRTLPFGIAQIGKAFRNEITPGNFIFRTREFEQMEIEYFVREKEWEKWFEYWLDEMKDWLKIIGVPEKKLNFNDVMEGERAHYSKRTIDIEYEFPFGMKELYGLAYRGDFDLKNHFKKEPYKDAETGEEFWPHVIEPSLGVDRTVLAVLCESYHEERERVVLKIPKQLAPVNAAVFPLLANKPDLVKLARKIYDDLRKDFTVAFDDRGNIGKRYYSQDEIGTPFCLTVDFESLENDEVTVRDRDTMKQERVKIKDLSKYLSKKFS